MNLEKWKKNAVKPRENTIPYIRQTQFLFRAHCPFRAIFNYLASVSIGKQTLALARRRSICESFRFRYWFKLTCQSKLDLLNRMCCASLIHCDNVSLCNHFICQGVLTYIESQLMQSYWAWIYLVIKRQVKHVAFHTIFFFCYLCLKLFHSIAIQCLIQYLLILSMTYKWKLISWIFYTLVDFKCLDKSKSFIFFVSTYNTHVNVSIRALSRQSGSIVEYEQDYTLTNKICIIKIILY